MKKKLNDSMGRGRLAVLTLLSLLAGAGWLSGAVVENVEPSSWTGGEVYGPVTVSNAGSGMVLVSFAAQDVSQQPPTFAAVDIVTGGDPAASPFAGDYEASGVSHMAFKVRLNVTTNAMLTFIMKGGSSGCLWKRDAVLSATPNVWVTNIVSMKLSDGWRNDGAPNAAEQWAQDIKNVEFAGVRIIPGGVGAQTFSVDSFILIGQGFATAPAMLVALGDALEARFGVRNLSELTSGQKTQDLDGDGMRDVDEILAGTNPDDRNSVFAAQVVTITPQGVTIKWPCVEGGVYTVSRTSNLVDGQFTALPTGYRLTATSSGYMEFTDTTAGVDGGPYFYRIVKE